MGRKILVLYYHMVSDISRDWNGLAVSPDTFRKQMEYIKKHYKILRADADWSTEEDFIVVTFDDGYEDNYINALPILENLKIPAAFFLCTGNIDKNEEIWCNELVWLIFEGKNFEKKFVTMNTPFQFKYETTTLYQRIELYRILRSILPHLKQNDRELIIEELRRWGHASDRKNRKTHRMMTSEQIRQLSGSEYAVIGAHTVSHPSLGSLSLEEQFEEIKGSKVKLENIIQKRVKLFSYPFGDESDYSDETIEILKDLGFERAMTTRQECLEDAADEAMYKIPRICIRECNMVTFSGILNTYFGTVIEDKDDPIYCSFEYVGGMEADQKLFEQNTNIVIWGAGERCKYILSQFEKWNILNKVRRIYDSSVNKVGMILGGISVFNIADYRTCENEVFVLAISRIGKTWEQIDKYRLKNIHYYV